MLQFIEDFLDWLTQLEDEVYGVDITDADRSKCPLCIQTRISWRITCKYTLQCDAKSVILIKIVEIKIYIECHFAHTSSHLAGCILSTYYIRLNSSLAQHLYFIIDSHLK